MSSDSNRSLPDWSALCRHSVLAVLPSACLTLFLLANDRAIADAFTYVRGAALTVLVGILFSPLVVNLIIKLLTGSHRRLHPVCVVLPMGFVMHLAFYPVGIQVARTIPTMCEVTYYEDIETSNGPGAGFHITASGKGNPRSFGLTHAWFGSRGNGQISDMSVELRTMEYYHHHQRKPLTRELLRSHIAPGDFSDEERDKIVQFLWTTLHRCRDGEGLPRMTWRSATPTPWRFVYHANEPAVSILSALMTLPFLLAISVALSKRYLRSQPDSATVPG